MSKSISLLIIIAVFLILGAVVFAGWTEPTGAPPGGNVPALINVSPVKQTKAGPLRIGVLTPANPSILLFTDTLETGGGAILNTGGAANGLIVQAGNAIIQGGKVGVNLGTDLSGLPISPDTELDIAGAVSIRGVAAPAVAPPSQGRIYFDSLDNKFKVSQNGGSYQDLLGGGALPGGSSGQTLRHDGTGWLANSLIFNNGTDVGIGTQAPGAALHVQPGLTTAAALKLRPQSTLSGYTLTFTLDNTAAFIKHDSGSRDLRLGAGNRDDITIKGIDGKVGIGTISPAATLDVAGNLQARILNVFGDFPAISIQDFGNDEPAVILLQSWSLQNRCPGVGNNSHICFYRTGSLFNPFLDIDPATGNVGIGVGWPTLANARLEVAGGIRLNTTDAQSGCTASLRGTIWFRQGAAGAKDTLEVCAKNASDLYGWRTLW